MNRVPLSIGAINKSIGDTWGLSMPFFNYICLSWLVSEWNELYNKPSLDFPPLSNIFETIQQYLKQWSNNEIQKSYQYNVKTEQWTL